MPLARKNNLILDHAQPQDAEALGGIFFSGFHDVAYFRKMIPDSPQARRGWTDNFAHCMKDPYTIVLKVTDADTNDIVCMGRWVKPKREGDKHQPAEEEGRYSDEFMGACDEELANALFGSFAKYREEMMGERPHYYMELLGTADRYKGQGAGGLIIQHGCDLADKDGVDCYIDSSPRGKRLYEKFGFVFTEVEQLPMDYHYNFGVRKPMENRSSTT